MVEHPGLIDRTGVVIQPARNGQIDGEVFLRHAEGGQIAHDGRKLVEAGVELLVTAAVLLQRSQHLGVRAGGGDEAENFVGLIRRDAEVVDQRGLDLPGADLVELVHGAHDVAGLLGQAEDGVKAVENFPVVDADAEALHAKRGEYLINNRRNFGLVDDAQLAVADDVDVGLIKFAEAAALGALTAVDLADGVAPEGKGQLVFVQGDVFCQRDGLVKAEGKIGIALLEAINLLFRLAAALGQQHLGGLDGRRVDGGKAVERKGLAQDLQHSLQLLLRRGQQLHKAG